MRNEKANRPVSTVTDAVGPDAPSADDTAG
jgi:hypothetical protein